MGNLLKTPHSELHATLEILERLGVEERHLTLIRKDPARASVVAQTMIGGYVMVEPEKPPAPTQPIIDCDSAPYIPDGWKVKEGDQLPGRVRGQVVWDPAKINLYLSENQQNGKYIEGDKLQKELAKEPVLPANILDYLLKNPHLIPEEWKKDANGNTRYIFFWGTVYRDSGGNLYVRCLYFSDGRWYWDCLWLGLDWYDFDPAAVLASS